VLDGENGGVTPGVDENHRSLIALMDEGKEERITITRDVGREGVIEIRRGDGRLLFKAPGNRPAT
jgi:hypothetical protein